MHRTTWGIIYCVAAAGILASAILLGRSIATDSEPFALTGVSLCIVSVAASRFASDHGWLKTVRSSVAAREAGITQAEIQIHTRSSLLESQTQRALREMDEIEGQRAERNEADRATMRAEIAAERDAMIEEFEAQKSAFREDAMRLGHMLGVRGLDAKAVENMAQVITLPVGEHRPTTMGEGRINRQ